MVSAHSHEGSPLRQRREVDADPPYSQLQARSSRRDECDRPRLIRTLGRGRGAIATLVDGVDEHGRPQQVVEKTFRPGMLTRVVYRIAFGSPFAYAKNSHAVRAAFYRRRVAAAGFRIAGIPVDVAMARYIRFDREHQAWVLAADYVQGCGPIPHSVADPDHRSASDLGDWQRWSHAMRSACRVLGEMGLYGSTWQVDPAAIVTPANLLCRRDTPVGASRWTVVDLESGMPALTVPKSLWAAWKRWRAVPFDDLDADGLKRWLAGVKSSDPHGETFQSNLHRDVERLIHHQHRWKQTEGSLMTALVRPSRRKFMLAERSRQLSRAGWTRRLPAIDRRQAVRRCGWMNQLPVFRAVFLRIMAHPRGMRPPLRFVHDRRFRRRWNRRWWRSETVRWRSRNRRDATISSNASAVLNRTLGTFTSAPVHRMVCRPSAPTNIARRLFGRWFRRGLAGRWFRRQVLRSTTEDRRIGRLDAKSAAVIGEQLRHASMSVYARGLAGHMSLKGLSPIVTPWKWGAAGWVAMGGSAWQLLPWLIVPTLRSLITASVWWPRRDRNIPIRTAACIGAVPSIGSIAYPIQMLRSHPLLSRYLVRRAASAVARWVPLWGGRDSRTELIFMAAALRMVRALETCVRSKPTNTAGETHDPESHVRLFDPGESAPAAKPDEPPTRSATESAA